jgi:hypothetical protein
VSQRSVTFPQRANQSTSAAVYIYPLTAVARHVNDSCVCTAVASEYCVLYVHLPDAASNEAAARHVCSNVNHLHAREPLGGALTPQWYTRQNLMNEVILEIELSAAFFTMHQSQSTNLEQRGPIG